MSHLKNSIAASLALIVFLTSSAAFAEGDSSATAATPDTAKSAPKKPAKKKRTKAAAKSAAPAASSATPASETPAAAPNNTPTPPASVAPAAPAAAAPSTGEAKSVAPASPAAQVGGDESPEAIKLRSGSGDPVAGKDKSELCQGCHGEEGVSVEGFAPKLAGQYGPYIAKQLRNFQTGARIHQIMSDIAATVSDDDLADISAYFASRKKMMGAGSENKVGMELFLHGDMSRMMVACVNCHGVNGKGKTPSNPVFPVIGGQHKDYLRGQLINFRAGDRSNSPGGVMNIITQKLTDTELDALADYVSGL